MAHGRDSPTTLQRARATVHDALPATLQRRETVVLTVGVIAVFALAIRLVLLGVRPAHWDEGRVAYWALRYQETGAFAYRHIIHGPFIQHVDAWLFALFGPSDFVARLPVAIVGGLFPLSALLFRRHLRDYETVILALLLASNAVLLYYSRFMRSDVLVAAFMLTGFGFLVRLYDTRRKRYLYPAAVMIGFGVASKENAVLYVLTWIGGLALVADTTFHRPRSAASGLALVKAKVYGGIRSAPSGAGPSFTPSRVRRVVGERTRRLPGLVRKPIARTIATVSWVFRRLLVLVLYFGKRYLGHVIAASALLVGVWLFFFAARGGNVVDVHPVEQWQVGTVGFWEGVTNPTKFLDMFTTTAEYWRYEYFAWFNTAGGGDNGLLHKWQRFGPKYLEAMLLYAAPITFFSVVGFLRERYAATKSRNLVMLFGYAGFVSALAYPFALDILALWNTAHAIVPLTIPAAVGIGVIYRWGRESYADGDLPSVALVALLLLLLTGQAAATSVNAVYINDKSDDNKLVQYGQPADNFGPRVSQIGAVAAENEGPDLLVYGNSFVKEGTSDQYLPGCMGVSGWFNALPVPWYFHTTDAEVTCAQTADDLDDLESLPPVIVGREPDIEDIEDRLGEYDVEVYRIRTSGSETAFLIREDALPE